MGAIHQFSIYQFDNLAHFLQGLYLIRDFVRNEHQVIELVSIHSRNELYLVADNSVAQFVYPRNSLYLVQEKSWTPVLPEMGAIHRISIYQFDNMAHFLQGLYIITDFVRDEHQVIELVSINSITWPTHCNRVPYS